VCEGLGFKQRMIRQSATKKQIFSTTQVPIVSVVK